MLEDMGNRSIESLIKSAEVSETSADFIHTLRLIYSVVLFRKPFNLQCGE